LIARERSEQEMLQHSVVQYDDARFFERAPVDFSVHAVVAKMIKRNRQRTIRFQSAAQRFGVIGHARG
jgi:hypothetical protein